MDISKRNSSLKDSTVMFPQYDILPDTVLPLLFSSLGFVWLNGSAASADSCVWVRETIHLALMLVAETGQVN